MAKSNDAQQRYQMRMESIRCSLKRLQGACEQRFGVPAEKAGWGEVGDVYEIDKQLKHLCDRIFKEGEYSPNQECRHV